jgi:hypothetical protein
MASNSFNQAYLGRASCRISEDEVAVLNEGCCLRGPVDESSGAFDSFAMADECFNTFQFSIGTERCASNQTRHGSVLFTAFDPADDDVVDLINKKK